MKPRQILLLFLLIGVLSGCDQFRKGPAAPPPTPTPANQKIDVLSEDQLPAKYTVVGTIRGYTIKMLQDRARKLGADAIINPRTVDPVSGWATTEAIKYDK